MNTLKNIVGNQLNKRITYFLSSIFISILLQSVESNVEIFEEEFWDQTIDLTKVKGWLQSTKRLCEYKTTVEYTGEIFGPFMSDITLNSKSYENLPPHWSVAFKVDLMMYGSIDQRKNEFSQIVLNNEPTDDLIKYSKVYPVGDDICQNYYRSFPYNYFHDKLYIVYRNVTKHTSSTFNVKINSYFETKTGNSNVQKEGYAFKYLQISVDTCFPTCSKCTGPSQKECTQCPAGSVLLDNQCTCSSGKIAHKYSCITSCPSGYVADSSNTFCIVSLCNANCQTCNTASNICSACKSGSFLFENECITSCPIYAPSSGQTCVDPNNTGTKAIVFKGLYEDTFIEGELQKYNLILSGFHESGGCVRKCGSKSILGGWMIGTNGTKIQKTVTISEPHYKVTFGFTIYLIDTWQQDDAKINVKYDNNKIDSIDGSVTGPNKKVQQLCGLSSDTEIVYPYSKSLDHRGSSFTFELNGEISRSAYEISFGIREIFISIEKCPDTCLTCTSASSCQSCKQGLQLSSGMCKVCNAGQYGNGLTCQSCHTDCATCFGNLSSNCQTCKTTKPYFYNNTCYDLCPNGTAPNTNNTCSACSNICLTCSQPNDSNQCKSCTGSLFFESNSCVGTCQPGSIGINNICTPCSSPCKTCSLSVNKCTSCIPGKILQGNLCKDNCDIGFYNNSGVCTECEISCNQCDGPSKTDCTACTGQKQLYSKQCIQTCPDQFFSSSNVCKNCYSGCLKCSSAANNNCTECISGNYLTPSNECLIDCPVNYYKDSKNKICAQCYSTCSRCIDSNATNCLECKTNYYLSDGQCKSTCPLGFYGNKQNLKCESCNGACKNCNGPSQSECTQCDTTYLNPNQQCLTSCPDTYFKNQIAHTCDRCTSPCGNCDLSATQCTSCLTGFLYQQTCPSNCPVGMFGNTSLKKCEVCQGNCKTCQNTATFCLTCKDKTYLKNNSCVETCNAGEYADDSSQSCKPCDNSCSSCVGPNKSDCRSCSDGKFYDKTNSVEPCQDNCPSHYFKNTSNKQCEECDISCKSCKGKLKSQCEECNNGVILFQQQCINKCPDKYFQKDNTCFQCHSECFNCSDDQSTSCTQCTGDRYLENHMCVDTCSITKFKNISNNTCEDCNSCYSCKGPLTTDCLSCQGEYYLNPNGSCKTDCPSHWFKNVNNNKCEECDSSCEECSGKYNSCDKCPSGQFLDKDKRICSLSCPTSFYKETTSRECLKCNPTCDECSGPNSNQCTSCTGDKLFNQNKECKNGCDDGYYAIPSLNVCKKCDNCKTCIDTEKKCLTCESDKFLLVDECIIKCPSDYYPNSNRECLKCDTNCLTCQNTSVECHSCDKSKSLYLNHSSSTCNLDCPDKTYKDDNISECIGCHTSCKSCSSNLDNKCLSCENSYLHQGMCLQDCPKGFFKTTNNTCEKCDDNCESCSDNAVSCDKCISGLFLDTDTKTCSNTCKSSYYSETASRECKKCNTNCKECDGPDADECTKCDGVKLLTSTHECNTSCSEGYYAVLVENLCKKCDANCKGCIENSTQCTSCDSNSFLKNKKCDSLCSGHFYATPDKQCLECDSNCLTCSNSAIECLTCDDTLDLFLNTNTKSCTSNCPSKTFKNNSNRECTNCHGSCQSCSSSDSSHCLSCENSYLFEGKCQPNCPDHYFQDNDNHVCKRCHETCSSCSNEKQTSCNTCYDNLFFNSIDSSCREVNTCPNHKFANQRTKTCDECNTACATCEGSSSDECLDCQQGYLKHGKSCYQKCPDNMYQEGNECKDCHGSCQKCSDNSISSCIICLDKDLFLENGKCIQKCSEGYYYDNTQPNQKTCKKCSTQCNICSGPSDKECTSCNSPQYLLNFKCVDKCQTPLIIDEQQKKCYTCPDQKINHQNTCVFECPFTTYSSQGVCLNCGTFCDKCTDNSTCQQCQTNYYLQNGKCVSSCDTNFFLQNQSCLQCSSDCKTCSGQSNKQCITCDNNRYFLQGECLSKCPQKYYQDKTQCSSCDSNCLECQNESTFCIKCYPDFGLYQGKCLSITNPPEKTYYKEGNFIPCDSSCNSCTAGTSKDCKSCDSNKYLIENQCFSQCPAGYFKDNSKNICSKCNENCNSCISSTECQKCSQNYFLDKNVCVKTCAELVQYADEMNQKCVNCHPSCSNKGCTGETESDCVKDDELAIGEYIMFKVFLVQSVLYSAISIFGITKDIFDSKKKKQTSVTSVHPEEKQIDSHHALSERETVVDSKIEGADSKFEPIESKMEIGTGTQLKLNSDSNVQRKKRQFGKKMSRFSQVSSMVEAQLKENGIENNDTPPQNQDNTPSQKGSPPQNDDRSPQNQFESQTPYTQLQSGIGLSHIDQSAIGQKASNVSSMQILTSRTIEEQTPAIRDLSPINQGSKTPTRTKRKHASRINIIINKKFESLPTFSQIESAQQSYNNVPSKIFNESSLINELSRQKNQQIIQQGGIKKLHYIIHGHETIQIFSMHIPDCGRFQRALLVYAKYVILVELIYLTKDTFYGASLAMILVAQLAKLILNRGFQAVSIFQRFQGLIPILILIGLSLTNTLAGFVPQLKQITTSQDQKWSISYLIAFAFDILIFQFLISFAIFKISLLSISNTSYKLKCLAETLFKQKFMVSRLSRKK